MKAEAIIIGDEILFGLVREENTNIIISKLNKKGFFVSRITIIRDDENEIADAITSALRRGSRVIITTGGLGPTEDDKTLETVAKLFRRKLIYDEKLKEKIRKCFNREVPKAAYKMARVIEDAKTYPSPLGLVSGQVIKTNNSYLIVLPGPPREVETLLDIILDDLAKEMGIRYRCVERVYIEAKEAEIANLLINVNKKYGVYAKALITKKTDKGLPVEILSFGENRELCEKKVKDAIKYIKAHVGK